MLSGGWPLSKLPPMCLTNCLVAIRCLIPRSDTGGEMWGRVRRPALASSTRSSESSLVSVGRPMDHACLFRVPKRCSHSSASETSCRLMVTWCLPCLGKRSSLVHSFEQARVVGDVLISRRRACLSLIARMSSVDPSWMVVFNLSVMVVFSVMGGFVEYQSCCIITKVPCCLSVN